MNWTARAWKAAKDESMTEQTGRTCDDLNRIGRYLLTRPRRTHPKAFIIGHAALTRWKLVTPV